MFPFLYRSHFTLAFKWDTGALLGKKIKLVWMYTQVCWLIVFISPLSPSVCVWTNICVLNTCQHCRRCLFQPLQIEKVKAGAAVFFHSQSLSTIVSYSQCGAQTLGKKSVLPTACGDTRRLLRGCRNHQAMLSALNILHPSYWSCVITQKKIMIH